MKHLKLCLVFSLVISSPYIFGSTTKAYAVLLDPQTQASSPSPSPSSSPTPKAHTSDQILVKLNTQGPKVVTACLHCLVAHHVSIQDYTTDHSNTLDQLIDKYGVASVEHVFIPEAKEKQIQPIGILSLASMNENSVSEIEQIKKKYPNRTKRAPKDAQIPDLSGWYVLKGVKNVDEALKDFRQNPYVEEAQPAYLMKYYSVPNDSYYSSAGSWGQPYDDLWGLKKIHAEEAWDLAKGQGIIIAVVDSGVDITHPDIQSNIWINSCEDLNHNGIYDLSDENGKDDACPGEEPNGYKDDIAGYDGWGDGGRPYDYVGHGTHVAGIIGAVGDNGIGIIGVAPEARIMPAAVRFGGSSDFSDVVKSIMYALKNGADVINNSWGCSEPCPSNPVVEDAVRFAHGVGAVVVFAAGNDSDNTKDYSPQNMIDSKPIVVGASSEKDQPTFFSEFGYEVDLLAPGGDSSTGRSFFEPYRNILSLQSMDLQLFDLAFIVGLGVNAESRGLYLRNAGTSMSAPYVSGAAALLVERHPDWTNEDIRQALRASAQNIGIPGWDVYSGAGRLDLKKALNLDSVLKVKIKNISTEANSDNPGITKFVVSAETFGNGFKRYEFYYKPENINFSRWISIGESSSAPLFEGSQVEFSISNLAKGVPYVLKLRAIDKNNHIFEDFRRFSVEFNETPPVAISSGTSNIVSVARYAGKIVWSTEDGGIYLYDLANPNKGEQKINQVTLAQPGNVAISSKIVSWIDVNRHVYFYDLNHPENKERQVDLMTTIAPERQEIRTISVYENKVVWVASRDLFDHDASNDLCDAGNCLMMKDTSDPNSKIRVLLESNNFLYTLVIKANHLFYIDHNGLSYFNLDSPNSKPTQIDGDDLLYSSLSEFNGKIVYLRQEDSSGETYKFYARLVDLNNLSYGPKDIPLGSKTIQSVSIFGNYIIFDKNEGFKGINPDTGVADFGRTSSYVYDLAHPERDEQPLASNLFDQKFPVGWQDDVVCIDYRDGASKIYLYKIPSYLNPKLTLNSSQDNAPLTKGCSYPIQWTSKDVNKVRIDLYDFKNGYFKRNIATNLEASSGTYQWTVPADLNLSDDDIYVIRITSLEDSKISARSRKLTFQEAR